MQALAQVNKTNIKYRLIIYNLFVSIFVLMIITSFDLRESFSFMLVYAINSSIVFASLLYLEIKYFNGLNFNILLLVGYCTRLVIPAVTKAIDAINGIGSYNLISENVTTDYMFPTAVWMNIYYMLFYFCVLRFSKGLYLEEALKNLFSKFRVSLFIIPVFAIGIAYNILISYVPAGIIPGIINTVFGRFVNLSLMMALFDTLFAYKRSKYIQFILMIVIAIIQASFWGFYKGGIMNCFLFFLLYYFLDRKYNNKRVVTPPFIMLCISMFLFLYLIVYPFMQTKRVVSGWGPETGYVAIYDYSNLEILGDVLTGKAKFENTDSGSRFDAIDANAFFYKESCKKNWHTTVLLKSNLELLVPRFINPNKHNAEAGLMVSGYVLQGSFGYKDTIGTSNYVGQFASAYLIGGPLLVILFALFNGWFYTIYYNFLIRHYYNIIALMLTISFLFSSLQAFEEIHDGGVLNAGVNTAMMIVVYFVSKIKILNFKH